MVKINYYRKLNRVTIEGHANTAEKGEDIVCASVSILANTLGAFVENLKKARQVYNPIVDLKEGDALICCAPPNKYKSSVTLVFDSICGGFELLARDYPENVNYEIK